MSTASHSQEHAGGAEALDKYANDPDVTWFLVNMQAASMTGDMSNVRVCVKAGACILRRLTVLHD